MAWSTPERWKEGRAAAIDMEESNAERKAERIRKAERKADLPPMNEERRQSPGRPRRGRRGNKQTEREFHGAVQKAANKMLKEKMGEL